MHQWYIFIRQVNDKMISGHIVDDISNHLPSFTLYIKTNVQKSEQLTYTYRRKFNGTVWEIACGPLDNSSLWEYS